MCTDNQDRTLQVPTNFHTLIIVNLYTKSDLTLDLFIVELRKSSGERYEFIAQDRL